jgi:hypothetical protein
VAAALAAVAARWQWQRAALSACQFGHGALTSTRSCSNSARPTAPGPTRPIAIGTDIARFKAPAIHPALRLPGCEGMGAAPGVLVRVGGPTQSCHLSVHPWNGRQMQAGLSDALADLWAVWVHLGACALRAEPSWRSPGLSMRSGALRRLPAPDPVT